MNRTDREMFVYLASGFKLNFSSRIDWTRDSLDWINHVPKEVLDPWVKYLDSQYQNYEVQNLTITAILSWITAIKRVQAGPPSTLSFMGLLYYNRLESMTLDLLFSNERESLAGRVRQALEHLQDMMYRHYFDVSTDASVGAIGDTGL